MVPTQTFAPADVALAFTCDNSNPAAVTSGVNTFLLSSSDTAPADIVALALTASNDGIVSLASTSSINAFATATVNVGASETITMDATTATTLPIALTWCETDPATAVCRSPAMPTDQPVSLTINSDATPTFSIFVTAQGSVAFDPAGHRINVRFTDPTGALRGLTSVAVRTLEEE